MIGGQMVWVGIILVILAFVVFISATEHVKFGEFGDISWWLIVFGIYQWGQALILAGFWILFGLACIFWWSPNQAMYGYVLFHIVRAMIELLLLLSGKYTGLLSEGTHSDKRITADQRSQLYFLGQGLIILGGLLILPAISIN